MGWHIMQMKSRYVCVCVWMYLRALAFLCEDTRSPMNPFYFNHDTFICTYIHMCGLVLRFVSAFSGCLGIFPVPILCVTRINYLHTKRFMVKVLKLNVNNESSQKSPPHIPSLSLSLFLVRTVLNFLFACVWRSSLFGFVYINIYIFLAFLQQ